MNGTHDAIHDEHRALRRELNDLERHVAAVPKLTGTRGWLDDLGSRLRALRPRLEQHFAHEVETGFFEQIREAWPNAERQCRDLEDEHAALLDRLEEASSAVSSGIPDERALSDLSGKVHALIRDLREHETRETDLFRTAIEGGPAGLD